jgi:methylamine dehydrogenase light chain
MTKKWGTRWLQTSFEVSARRVARHTSRRGFLAVAGRALVGAAALPLFPIDRQNVARAAAPKKSFAAHAQATDDTQCNYWRYCSLDGTLCSCCGGTVTSCPAGSVAPPSAWVGSCINPSDGQTYLVEYRDCCGKSICDRCSCKSTEGDTPIFTPQTNSDIEWCIGTDQMAYHCTISSVLAKL